jgi:hypothetical protein
MDENSNLVVCFNDFPSKRLQFISDDPPHGVGLKWHEARSTELFVGLALPQLPEWRACLRTVSTPFVYSNTHLLIF